MSDKRRLLTINGKKCPKCSKFKFRKDYYLHNNRADGLQIYCKRCTQIDKRVQKVKYNEVMRRWYNNKGYKKQAADRYGISINDYELLLEACGNRCQICLKENANNRRLSVDHNHETGVIRGVLCINCNSALGLFRDSPELMELAIKYLKENDDGKE